MNTVARPDEDALRAQVRDALRHLYDGAHLAKHPLGELLFPDPLPSGNVRSKSLRLRLLDAIEALRPEVGISREADAWRVYDILTLRYVETCPTEEVMRRVHLGRSQYHVAHRAALDALLVSLRGLSSEAGSPGAQTPSGKHSLLQRELHEMRGEQELGEVKLADVLRNVLAMFEPVVSHKGVALICDWGALHALPCVWADSAILRQLLVQALGNALRLLHHGRVRLAFDNLPMGIVLEVVVEGSLETGGMVEDWAIRDLGRALGAKLGEVVTETGSRLWVQLPTKRRRLAVLIDNDPDLGALFARYLSGYDWTLVAAQSADEGLSLVRQLKPDVVILDVIMPQQDGWQVLSALRADERPSRPAVIVCSVLEQPELVLALGGDVFLPKPVTQASLLLAMERLHRKTTGD